MFFTKSACIIVDAYSTGKNLAPAFKSRGYACIHIQSSEQLPSKYTHDKDNFIMSLTYRNNIEELVEKLAPYQIKICVPGYESGVELADLLSEKLGLISNDSAYSKARRDKYVMTELVSQAGIKTVKHFKSNDLEKILLWSKEMLSKESANAPVVLKPIASANGDGVFFCYDEQDIRLAFQKISLSQDQFGQHNHVILAQSYNPGQEYIVNTVSWQGQHFFVEMFRITKKPYSTIYEKAEIVQPVEKEWKAITAYVEKVLKATHHEYGAATTEVKYTEENGPVLLETSGRLMGNSPLSFLQEIAGFTQLSLMVDAYTNCQDFLRRIHQERSLLKNYGMAVVLIADCEGVLQADLDVSGFHQLKTLHSYVIDGEAGRLMRKTTDSLTAPGEIYLIADNKEALEKDYQQIRRLEQNGLYRHAIRPAIMPVEQSHTIDKPVFSETYPRQVLFQPGNEVAINKQQQSDVQPLQNQL